MGRGESKFELILLFDRMKMEPKKLHRWLKERGQEYSYYTLKKYYSHWGFADTMVRSIMETRSQKSEKK